MKNSEQLFVGLTENDAIKLANNSKIRFRVMERNNSSYVGDCLYDTSRINFYIKNGIVYKAHFG